MKLEQLQDDFISAIFNIDRDTAIDYIEGDENLTASQRLGIYRGSVHAILTQSLGITFPVCKALLGEEFFDKMCDRFIGQYPPTTPFFSEYGDKLSLFLSDFKPVETIPYIEDVANFEWSRHTLWQNQANEPFDFSAIEALDEEQQANIIFQLSPVLHLIQSKYRIDHIWFAHQSESEIKLEDIKIETEVSILIWKSNDAIKIVNFETNNLLEKDIISDNNISEYFSNQEFWLFLNAVSQNLNITRLATEFDKNFPELLNHSIQVGWIDSFTCD